MRAGPLAEISYRGMFVLVLLLGLSLFAIRFVSPLYVAKMGVAGLAAGGIALIAFAAPRYGLMISVFYIYAGLSYYFQFHASHPLVVLVAAGVLLQMLRGDSIHLTSPGFNWSVALLVMFIVQSMLIAYDVELSLTEFGRVMKPLVMVYLIVQLVRTPRHLHVLVLVIYFGSLVSVLLGILNFQLGWVESASAMPSGTIRFEGTHGGPNTYAVYLASALPLGVYLARMFRRWYSRTLIIISTLLILLMIFSTFSRAAVFPVAFVVLMILVRDVRNRLAFVVVVAAIVTAALSTPVSYWDRLATLRDLASGEAESSDWSLYLRVKSIQVAWRLFADHPFTGVGLANYVVRSGPWLLSRVDVHSSYLQVLIGLGIFGFLAYMAAYASAAAHFITAIRARWREQDEWMGHLAFYLLVGFLASLIGCAFGTDAFEYLTWVPTAGGLAAGLIAVRYARDRNDREGNDGE